MDVEYPAIFGKNVGASSRTLTGPVRVLGRPWCDASKLLPEFFVPDEKIREPRGTMEQYAASFSRIMLNSRDTIDKPRKCTPVQTLDGLNRETASSLLGPEYALVRRASTVFEEAPPEFYAVCHTEKRSTHDGGAFMGFMTFLGLASRSSVKPPNESLDIRTLNVTDRREKVNIFSTSLPTGKPGPEWLPAISTAAVSSSSSSSFSSTSSPSRPPRYVRDSLRGLLPLFLLAPHRKYPLSQHVPGNLHSPAGVLLRGSYTCSS